MKFPSLLLSLKKKSFEWIERMKTDFEILAEHSDEFHILFEDIEGKYQDLFSDEDFAARFQAVDCNIIKAAKKTVCIPPPGYDDLPPEGSDDDCIIPPEPPKPFFVTNAQRRANPSRSLKTTSN